MNHPCLPLNRFNQATDAEAKVMTLRIQTMATLAAAHISRKPYPGYIGLDVEELRKLANQILDLGSRP